MWTNLKITLSKTWAKTKIQGKDRKVKGCGLISSPSITTGKGMAMTTKEVQGRTISSTIRSISGRIAKKTIRTSEETTKWMM